MLISFLAFVYENNSDDKIIIKGEIEGDLEGYDKIHLYNNITEERDSARIENGEFRMEMPFHTPTRHMFYTEYARRVEGGYVPFGILIEEPGEVYLEADVSEGLHQANISGSRAHDIYDRFLEDLGEMNEEIEGIIIDKYGEEFYNNPDESDERYARMNQDEEELEMEMLPGVLHYHLSEHPDSFGSLFILDRYGRNIKPSDLQDLYGMLDDTLKELYEAERIESYIEGLRSSEPGSEVADFSLPGPDASTKNFRDYKGTYLLLDFWATWCVPCLESFPKLKEIHEQYAGEDFEILGISIDRGKDPWLSYLEENDLPWVQLYDDQELALERFAVRAIPRYFLVNPEGEIMDNDVDVDGLEETLDELIGD